MHLVPPPPPPKNNNNNLHNHCLCFLGTFLDPPFWREKINFLLPAIRGNTDLPTSRAQIFALARSPSKRFL